MTQHQLDVSRKLSTPAFDKWRNGDQSGARSSLVALQMLYPKVWGDMVVAADPPPGFVDAMMDINEYSEWVVAP